MEFKTSGLDEKYPVIDSMMENKTDEKYPELDPITENGTSGLNEKYPELDPITENGTSGLNEKYPELDSITENGTSGLDEKYPGLDRFSDLDELMEKARRRRVTPHTQEYRHQYRDKYSNWYYYRNSSSYIIRH